MAWTGLALTVEGQNALNQAQVANSMNIKSIVIGDGNAPANFRTQKALVHQLYEITDLKVDIGNGKCVLTADIPQMDYDYYFREIGVIVITDDGEKLYVYDNCSDSAQYIVSTTAVEATRKRIRLSLNISDVAEITVMDSGIMYVAYEDFEKAVGELNDTIKNGEKRMDGHLADAIASHKSIMDELNEAIGKKANEEEFNSHTKDTTAHITAAERTAWNDANTKKHTHDNASVLDGITNTLITGWNSAVDHISDAVKHITSAERDKWNNGSHNYGTCSTDAATAAKAVACTGFKLAVGAEIAVRFTVINAAASSTLNVNSTGAKPIYYRGAAIPAGYLAANRTYTFRYNGIQWDLVGDINTDTKYTHPTTSGNKHIPSGGAAGQILRWSADGTAVWGADNNTTYGNMKGATADAAGAAGLAPAPAKGAANRYLRSDGTWQVPPDTNTTYSNMAAATASAAGKAGLVPAPAKGAQNNYLTGGGTWQNVDDHAAAFTSGDVVSPTGWANIDVIATGEKLSSLIRKFSLTTKNVRYLWKLLGSTSLTGIGDGTVTGAINSLNTGMDHVGKVATPATATANVASGNTNTPTSICSMWLVPGVYIIDATAKFTLPKQSQLEVHIGTDDGNAISSLVQNFPAGIQWVKNVGILTITGTASKNVILKVRQDSGTIISCTGLFYATRIR